MDKQIVFRFGFFAPSAEEQANAQGYTFGEDAEVYDNTLEAYLILRDYMTDKQEESIRNKIGKTLMKKMKPLKEVKNDRQGNNQ